MILTKKLTESEIETILGKYGFGYSNEILYDALGFSHRCEKLDTLEKILSFLVGDSIEKMYEQTLKSEGDSSF